MNQGFKYLKAFWRDERGATAIEYGVIVGLIVVGIILSLRVLGGSSSGSLDDSFTAIADVI